MGSKGGTKRDEVAQNEVQPAEVKVARRQPLMQKDVPGCSLDDALRIPRTLGENYAFKPSRPLDVAAALNMQPTAGTFRMLCGAALAYGLTQGGWNAATIAALPLARRILEPTVEGDDLQARREAFLIPRVVGEFLKQYDGSRLPREDIGTNVLVQMGVPRESAKRTFEMIVNGARAVGMLRDIKDAQYVNLHGSTGASLPEIDSATEMSYIATVEAHLPPRAEAAPTEASDSASGARRTTRQENRRVFLTHGKNKAFLDPLKDLLAFGELEAVISVERESVSQPVPDKVMSDMRSCSAAIIHVDAEQRLIDADGETHMVLNPNVLIEIGGAMALYGRRFILLVKDGIQLPSNLQGLYEVRYSGEKLDGDATIKLLKAIKDIKNHPLPD